MSDFFTPEQVTVLSASTVRMVVLVQLDFTSGSEYIWNGNTPLVTTGGTTWQPMHGALRITGLGFSGSAKAVSEVITLELNGLPFQEPDLLAIALGETSEVDQRMLTVNFQFFDSDWQVSGLPIPIFRGFMQPPKVTRTSMQGENGAEQLISMNVENIFFGRSRPPHGRNTDRDQQNRSSGDLFFGFVSDTVSRTIRWPDF